VREQQLHKKAGMQETGFVLTQKPMTLPLTWIQVSNPSFGPMQEGGLSLLDQIRPLPLPPPLRL
jgi:hypothetical protein